MCRMKTVLIIFLALLLLSCHVAIGFTVNSYDNLTEYDHNDGNKMISSNRSPRSFPFYTIGRFENSVCVGSNSLTGTCVLKGQCDDLGGTQTGNFACSGASSKQAQCCILTRTCGTNTNFNNTYFTNPSYPAVYGGGSRCNIAVTRSGVDICQLRVDFLDFDIAQPTGEGVCSNDYFTITGGSSFVPRICGKNIGQHVYVNFADNNPLTVTVATSSSFTYSRRWNLQLSMIACSSTSRAPDGCLQYWQEDSNTISSFNYDSTGPATANSIGVQGSRQIANMFYGACVRPQPGMCTITWTIASDDPYAFTLTGDVGAVPTALLGTVAVQSTTCTTDFVTIPAASQTSDIINGGTLADGDRFCGLGIDDTSSNVKPFVIYSTTDGNETPDIGNRGWSLTYSQNMCPV